MITDEPRPTVTAEAFGAHGVFIRVEGDLDLALAPALADVIATELARGHRHLVVDLSGATLLDCASIGTLLRGVAPLSSDPAAAVVLAGASGIVSRFLSLLEFDQIFEIVQDSSNASEIATARTRRLTEGWRELARGEANRSPVGMHPASTTHEPQE